MPVEDDLRQAIADGRLGPEHVVFMHPADFNRTRAWTDFGSSIPGVPGAQVISSPLIQQGHIQILHRDVLSPPSRMVIHSSNLPSLMDQIGWELRDPAFIVPHETFQHTITIRAEDLREDLREDLYEKPDPEPAPKSLWELLEEDE